MIGLFDAEVGLGRRYLEDLGVAQLLPVSTPTAELAAGVGGDRTDRPRRCSAPGAAQRPSDLRAGRRGQVVVWTTVSGGVGLTEAVLAAAEWLAGHGRTLLIEANPMAAVLAARLGRDPAFGLAWTLGRVAHGHSGLPEGLSPPRPETTGGLGHFDVICQTSGPGGPPAMVPGHLAALVEEARGGYEQVLVEAGPVLGPSPKLGVDRFSAGRAIAGAG